jgi:RimJ/RimL family protein N-acetyltransferase
MTHGLAHITGHRQLHAPPARRRDHHRGQNHRSSANPCSKGERMSVAAGRLWLETRRLTLRPLCDDDLDDICLLLGDTDALALWGAPLDRGGARRWIERNMTRYQADCIGRCAIVLRATGRLVGDCGLIRTTVEGVDEVELGWIVRKADWGRGIATEAGEAWRDHAFSELGLRRIVSMISEQNVASRRVAEKLGMTVERAAIWDGQPMLMYPCVGPDASRTIQSGPQNREADL